MIFITERSILFCGCCKMREFSVVPRASQRVGKARAGQMFAFKTAVIAPAATPVCL
jgi:hypothetical protein